MADLIVIEGQELAHSGGHDLAHNAAAVYLAGLAAGSRPAMRGALDNAAEIWGFADAFGIPWHAIEFQHVAALRAALSERYSYRTVNKTLSAVRGAVGAAYDLGQISGDTYARIKRVKGVKGTTLPAGRSVASAEVAGLLAVCKANDTGIRDAAILATMYAAGLRRSELIGLDLADYNPATHALKIRQGKGNKQRMAYPVAAAEYLTAWLAIRGTAAGALFWGTGNRNMGGRLTSQAIYDMIKRRARQAGINTLSPHDLRRTFVSDMLDNGADLSAVKQAAGHARVETTARYDRRGERAAIEAAGLLHLPAPKYAAAKGSK